MNNDSTNKIKHLEMIQAIITRMAHCSFMIKGWCVILVASLLALSAPKSNPAFVMLAFIPTLMFWGLDAYYLWQERLFRKVYDKVRKLDNEHIDFSMNPREFLGDTHWKPVLWSATIFGFYGPIAAAIVAALVLTMIINGVQPDGT